MRLNCKRWKLVLLAMGGVVLILAQRTLRVDFQHSYASVSNRLARVARLAMKSLTGSHCGEKTRIAFIKVHKAASTTVTSIIQQYGMRHNLTFAIPKEDLYHIGFFNSFDPKAVLELKEGNVYEVLCQHVVYNREAFRKYLPSDMFVIASVREPFQRFVSAFLFFQDYKASLTRKNSWKADRRPPANSVVNLARLNQIVKTNRQMFPHRNRTPYIWNGHPVELLMGEYLRDPEFYEPLRFKRGSLALNRMSFDLGIPKEKYLNVTFVNHYIQQLDQDMTLVLVHEYFDQSLVLLKRKLCWSMKDILYLVQHKGPPKPQLPEDLKTLHRQKAPSEYQIYDFFKNKLLTLIEQEPYFGEEVELFKKTLLSVLDFCRQPNHILQINGSQFDEGFSYTKQDCYFLKLREIPFVKYLIEDHKKRGVFS